MKDVLKLTKPIAINGETVTEIPYDFDELTAEDLLNIDKTRATEGRLQPVVPKLEGYMQFMLFAEAVSKVDPHIAIEDLRRLSLKDAFAAQEAARNFLYSDEIEAGSEAGEPTTSDAQSPASL